MFLTFFSFFIAFSFFFLSFSFHFSCSSFLWESALPSHGCGNWPIHLRIVGWPFLLVVGGSPSHPSWGSDWPVLLVLGVGLSFSGCESALPLFCGGVRQTFQGREVGPSEVGLALPSWAWPSHGGVAPSLLCWCLAFPSRGEGWPFLLAVWFMPAFCWWWLLLPSCCGGWPSLFGVGGWPFVAVAPCVLRSRSFALPSRGWGWPCLSGCGGWSF